MFDLVIPKSQWQGPHGVLFFGAVSFKLDSVLVVHMSHDHDTLQAGHFKIKNMYCRTTLKSMCLSIRGPVMWNKLHSDLKNSTTVNMFKKRYKTFLVSEYEVT